VTISADLKAHGEPLIAEQLTHPFLMGLQDGTLAPEQFRGWLEQDYLFLLDYVRVFSRLAWQAPPEHLGDLVDLAHATWHDELALHRAMSADYGADLAGAVKGPACVAYTEFLMDAAADYRDGLVALLPCMWGYSRIGQLLQASVGDRPNPYRRWIDTYADPGFATLADRCAVMLDESGPEPARAERLFLTAMGHERAFWEVS
jgi:thiaminase/transcriptional activator TenA